MNADDDDSCGDPWIDYLARNGLPYRPNPNPDPPEVAAQKADNKRIGDEWAAEWLPRLFPNHRTETPDAP